MMTVTLGGKGVRFPSAVLSVQNARGPLPVARDPWPVGMGAWVLVLVLVC